MILRDMVSVLKTFVTRMNYIVSTTNHKTIGRLYLCFGIFCGFLGLCLSLRIRRELRVVKNDVLVSIFPRNFYHVIVTAHGLIMIFFRIMPILIGRLGNLFIPVLLGTPDMAFPRLNRLSFWLLPISLFFLLQ